MKVVTNLLFLEEFGQLSDPQLLILTHFVDEFHHFFFTALLLCCGTRLGENAVHPVETDTRLNAIAAQAHVCGVLFFLTDFAELINLGRLQ